MDPFILCIFFQNKYIKFSIILLFSFKLLLSKGEAQMVTSSYTGLREMSSKAAVAFTVLVFL